jgi:catechol 2,3-dioxygenase-like lactoylglutathione lyase family enzyme
MLHHLSIAVVSLERSSGFYDAVLQELGYARVWTNSRAIGYGRSGSGDKFAIKLAGRAVDAPPEGSHIAFAAPSREAVIRFHRAALAWGGLDNGLPGPRPAYGEHYFAAFVVDPDGYRLEAVLDEPVTQDG